MDDGRRKYTLEKSINVNGLTIDEAIIDPHVDKHKDHIDDELIISLITLLDGKIYNSVAEEDGFSYFLSKVLYKEKIYRLVWLLENNQFYIGVITSFKEKGAKDYDVS